MVDEDSVVVIDRMTPLNYIEIWEPVYSRRSVLINPRKVGDNNKIVFTKAPSLPLEYYLSGRTIRSHKKRSNGTMLCYEVPLEELKILKINERDLRLII